MRLEHIEQRIDELIGAIPLFRDELVQIQLEPRKKTKHEQSFVELLVGDCPHFTGTMNRTCAQGIEYPRDSPLPCRRENGKWMSDCPERIESIRYSIYPALTMEERNAMTCATVDCRECGAKRGVKCASRTLTRKNHFSPTTMTPHYWRAHDFTQWKLSKPDAYRRLIMQVKERRENYLL
jgi:hypothetical protein